MDIKTKEEEIWAGLGRGEFRRVGVPRGDDPQRAGSVDLMVSSGGGAEDTASEAIVFGGVENIAKGDYVE